MLSALVLLLVTAEPAALNTAREQLKAGKLDEVLFALEGQTIPVEHRAAAAEVLAQAGSLALAKNDELLALQLAQMALRQQTTHGVANEVAARASLKQQQFESAERYADAWIDSTKSPAARLFRAQLALHQADWKTVVTVLDDESVKGDEQADWMRAMARNELSARDAAKADIKIIEQETEKAAAQARSYKRNTQLLSAGSVVIYSPRDPNACAQVKNWLKVREQPYDEKTLDRDPFAFKELERRMMKERRRISFYSCVVDIRGRVFDSFDQGGFEQALKRP